MSQDSKISQPPAKISHNQDPQLQPGTQLGIIVEPFTKLTSQLAQTSLPTAPVKIPGPEELTVRLVNVSQLQRLDELRGDVALLQTILFTIVGTVLGFVTNVFTSNQAMDRSAWIFLVLLLGASVLFGVLTARASQRTMKLQRRLFDDTH